MYRSIKRRFPTVQNISEFAYLPQKAEELAGEGSMAVAVDFSYIRHVTRDTWHMTHDTWHLIYFWIFVRFFVSVYSHTSRDSLSPVCGIVAHRLYLSAISCRIYIKRFRISTILTKGWMKQLDISMHWSNLTELNKKL